jgi:hypothetical protein
VTNWISLSSVDIQDVVVDWFGEHTIWATPSPDGKHVAMPYHSANENVWMMENF